MKFRKKPKIVDAEQFLGPASIAINTPDPPSPKGVRWGLEFDDSEFARPYVLTAHAQRAWLVPGDWVLEEPDGRGYYPCKADIFERTYDAVEELSDGRQSV